MFGWDLLFAQYSPPVSTARCSSETFQFRESRLSPTEDTNLNKKFGWMLCLLALALCASSLPAMAGTLYSNLGAGGSYYCCEGWTISGTGTLGFSQSIGEQFQVSPGGSVSQIDVGVGYVEGTN